MPAEVVLLGEKKGGGRAGPLEHFEGKVIAVYHRFDDVEDKYESNLEP